MIALNKELAQDIANAIIRLENDESFIIIKSWVNASLDDIKAQLIETEGNNTLLAQGYAQALRDIAGTFNEPRKIIDRLKTLSENRIARPKLY